MLVCSSSSIWKLARDSVASCKGSSRSIAGSERRRVVIRNAAYSYKKEIKIRGERTDVAFGDSAYPRPAGGWEKRHAEGVVSDLLLLEPASTEEDPNACTTKPCDPMGPQLVLASWLDLCRLARQHWQKQARRGFWALNLCSCNRGYSARRKVWAI